MVASLVVNLGSHARLCTARLPVKEWSTFECPVKMNPCGALARVASPSTVGLSSVPSLLATVVLIAHSAPAVALGPVMSAARPLARARYTWPRCERMWDGYSVDESGHCVFGPLAPLRSVTATRTGVSSSAASDEM